MRKFNPINHTGQVYINPNLVSDIMTGPPGEGGLIPVTILTAGNRNRGWKLSPMTQEEVLDLVNWASMDARLEAAQAKASEAAQEIMAAFREMEAADEYHEPENYTSTLGDNDMIIIAGPTEEDEDGDDAGAD